MQNTTINAQLEILMQSNTDQNLDEALKDIAIKLSNTYPTLTTSQLKYWATRILFLTNGDADSFTLEFIDGPIDPTEIKLTFNPDYSS